VTDAGRYQPVVAHADWVVDRLVRLYDVIVKDVNPADALPERQVVSVVRAVRLSPREGAPLTVVVTDFPGLVLRWGYWSDARFPDCGCDACDEQPEHCIEALDEVVAQVVLAQFEETLSTRELRTRRWSSAGGRSGATRLTRQEYADLAAVGPRGTPRWKPWPDRADTT